MSDDGDVLDVVVSDDSYSSSYSSSSSYDSDVEQIPHPGWAEGEPYDEAKYGPFQERWYVPVSAQAHRVEPIQSQLPKPYRPPVNEEAKMESLKERGTVEGNQQRNIVAAERQEPHYIDVSDNSESDNSVEEIERYEENEEDVARRRQRVVDEVLASMGPDKPQLSRKERIERHRRRMVGEQADRDMKEQEERKRMRTRMIEMNKELDQLESDVGITGREAGPRKRRRADLNLGSAQEQRKYREQINKRKIGKRWEEEILPAFLKHQAKRKKEKEKEIERKIEKRRKEAKWIRMANVK
jgi:hypothetical protein